MLVKWVGVVSVSTDSIIVLRTRPSARWQTHSVRVALRCKQAPAVPVALESIAYT
jgi:hypothetical protein